MPCIHIHNDRIALIVVIVVASVIVAVVILIVIIVVIGMDYVKVGTDLEQFAGNRIRSTSIDLNFSAYHFIVRHF